jgi:hypothetical protein
MLYIFKLSNKLDFNQVTRVSHTSDIFEFLTGQRDTVAQFETFLTFSANPTVNIDTSKIAQTLTPIPPEKFLRPFKEHFLLPRLPLTTCTNVKKKLTTEPYIWAKKLNVTFNKQPKKPKKNANL